MSEKLKGRLDGARKALLSRKTLAVAAAAATALGGLFAFGGTAHADAPATVGNTDGQGLVVREDPNTTSAANDLVQTGDTVNITCQAVGESVTNTKGFTSDLWDFSEELGGYLADAYMATGHDGRIPDVPECEESTPPPPSGDITPIVQYQGQYTQWEDCGPTSVVSVLLSQGITPHGWDAANPVESIHRAREDMGLVRGEKTNGTNADQVNTAFATYDIDSYTSYDLDAILAHIRDGGSVVLAGNTVALPWEVRVADPNGVAHFLSVVGYDADSGNYLVVDPIAAENSVKEASADTLAAYFNHTGGGAGVTF